MHLQRSVPVQPKTKEILSKICQKLAATLRGRHRPTGSSPYGPGLAGPAVLLVVRPEAVVPPAAVCRVAADVRVMCKDTIK